ncbi:MAG: hypothetical protein JW915_01310 [Chitinispirillaceae bacterium]|nr:hypothetical protein [Chitinispirillaceae bacterium]
MNRDPRKALDMFIELNQPDHQNGWIASGILIIFRKFSGRKNQHRFTTWKKPRTEKIISESQNTSMWVMY